MHAARGRAARPRRRAGTPAAGSSHARDGSAAQGADRPLAIRDGTTLTGSRRGSRRLAPPAASPSTPRRPASTRCRPSSSASRWRVAPGKACYVPLGASRGRRRLRFRRRRAAKQVPLRDALDAAEAAAGGPVASSRSGRTSNTTALCWPARHRARRRSTTPC